MQLVLDDDVAGGAPALRRPDRPRRRHAAVARHLSRPQRRSSATFRTIANRSWGMPTPPQIKHRLEVALCPLEEPCAAHPPRNRPRTLLSPRAVAVEKITPVVEAAAARSEGGGDRRRACLTNAYRVGTMACPLAGLRHPVRTAPPRRKDRMANEPEIRIGKPRLHDRPVFRGAMTCLHEERQRQ